MVFEEGTDNKSEIRRKRSDLEPAEAGKKRWCWNKAEKIV